MSRSALWRQDAGVKEREQNAQESFDRVVEEGRNNRTKGLLQLYGPDDSFQLNPLLLNNIVLKSTYFAKTCCEKIQDWNALVDEIYYQVKHVEPWAAGQNSRTPSAAFCLLLRLLCMRCSEKQMQLLLDHVDSPYIRCIGFLYLRYAVDPTQLWRWIQPYLFDEELVSVQFNPATPEMTMGSYVRLLFGELDYYGTRLPRLPIATERDLKVKLLQAQQVEDRAKKHASNKRTMDHFSKLGSRIRALYEDADNPLTWYDGVVDRVLTTDPKTGVALSTPKYVVTFTEYGNTETVTLGEMNMTGGREESIAGSASSRGYGASFEARGGGGGRNDDRRGGYRHDDRRDGRRGYNDDDRRGGYDNHRRNDDRGPRHGGREDDRRRDRSRSREPQNANLMNEVLRREREGASSSKRGYAARPRDDHRKQAPDDDRRRSPPRKMEAPAAAERPLEKSREELATIADKKRRLMSKYG